MTKDYITRIKANISIYATKKSGNVLDGSYVSVFRGRSMNFEDLREYIPGDSLRDIDWKASSRSGNILVKRYIAEKKHNMMFILDTGKKLMGETPSGESKKDIALYSFGTLAYLAQKNGDQVSAAYIKGDKLSYEPFRTGMNNVEKLVSFYEADMYKNKESIGLQKAIDGVFNLIKRRMIIFIVTDMKGAYEIDENCIKRLKCKHDVLFVITEDAMITGQKGKSFDLTKERYMPAFIVADKKLMKMEKQKRQEMADSVSRKLEKLGVSYVTIGKKEDVVQRILELLERHKHVNNH